MVADSRLNRDIELLAWDQLFHLLHQLTTAVRRIIVVGDQRQRIYTLAVDQHVHAHHVGCLEAFEVVIQRRVATGGGLQAVKEIEHHFRHRNFIGQRNLFTVINHVGLHATLLNTQRDDVAQELLRQQHVAFRDRLTQLLNVIQRRQLGRAIDIDDFFRRGFHFVDNRRRGGNQIQVVFAFQTLLDDFHVQQAEEATAEAEAQRRGTFRLIEQRRIVQAQFTERITEGFIIIGAHREQTGIHLRFHFLKAWQGLVRRVT